MPIIDADAHVLESERTWDYLSESEAQFRPRIASIADGKGAVSQFWLVDGRLQPKSQNIGQETPKASREMEDLDARIRHMDDLGVDVQVLYPTLFLRPLTARPEVELALSRSYNRWLADIWKRGRGRLRWVAVLPLLSMEKALVEARWAKENGACGIFLRGLEGERRLSERYFFPLYEEASQLGLPVCVHSATGSFTVHDFFLHECGFSRFKLAVVGAFHSLIFEGIPELFPKLRTAFVEVSAQWVPYALHDLARRLERRGKRLKSNLLAEDRIYVACQTDDDLPYVLGYAGGESLVIGSDYGHADTSSELEALRTLKRNGKLDGAVIDRILDDNPRALYGL